MLKSKNTIITTIICSFLSALLFLTPISTQASQTSLSLSPVIGGPYQVGSDFSVSVWVKTGGNNVDTIRSSINFPTNLLEVQGVTLGSVYSAPAGGNTYNNSTGNIYWGGGAYGGTTSDATFATIVFRAKSSGTASVSFASNSLIISAGQAVPFVTSSGKYTIETTFQPTIPTPSVPTPEVTPQITPPSTTPTPLFINNTITSISKGKVPVFIGKVDVGQASIKFDIDNGLFTNSIFADENGNWQFSVPEGLAPGTYTMEITASHPQDINITATTSEAFEITITEALEVLFDVILDINKETKQIKAGEELSFHIKLLNFGENIQPTTTTNVNFNYIIKNIDREEVARFRGSRKVMGREDEFDKKITLPQDIAPGQYFISTQMIYGDNQEASSSDSFQIISPISTATLMGIVIAVIIMIIISIYYIWKRKPEKK